MPKMFPVEHSQNIYWGFIWFLKEPIVQVSHFAGKPGRVRTARAAWVWEHVCDGRDSWPHTVLCFPTEIVDGNIKMTLGMIWTIILRFAIQDISVEGELDVISSQTDDWAPCLLRIKLGGKWKKLSGQAASWTAPPLTVSLLVTQPCGDFSLKHM